MPPLRLTHYFAAELSHYFAADIKAKPDPSGVNLARLLDEAVQLK